MIKNIWLAESEFGAHPPNDDFRPPSRFALRRASVSSKGSLEKTCLFNLRRPVADFNKIFFLSGLHSNVLTIQYELLIRTIRP